MGLRLSRVDDIGEFDSILDEEYLDRTVTMESWVEKTLKANLQECRFQQCPSYLCIDGLAD